MAPLLRIIEEKQYWESPADYPWLPADQGPAVIMRKQYVDPQSAVSVFEVAEDEDVITQVVAAFAAASQHKDKHDYVLFPRELPGQVGLQVVNSPGKTPDATANAMHRDLVQVTCAQLGALFGLIYRSGRVRRIDAWRVDEAIREGIRAGRLDPKRVNPKLREYLELG